jgi:gluconolactonase
MSNRVDGKTGAMTVVADHIVAPNGLAFSPDESKLYVVESRSTAAPHSGFQCH